MKTTYTLIALVTLAVATGATAANMNKGKGNNMQQPEFVQLDLNQDGQVTEDEFNQAKAERIEKRTEEGRTLRNISASKTFEAVDTNGDGVLTKDEFLAQRKDGMNANRGGKQSKSMKSNMQRPDFATFDIDGDKSITQKEFDTYRAAKQQKVTNDGRALNGKRQADVFTAFDTNGDGVISEEEFAERQSKDRQGKKRS
ncbi:EF-hand domain-containing protein [Vibrio tapetis subsp. quintayensis]|uniref:EF-hand domain-containing protein n=1 Tax=Vibrio tapetis TaxID=52443 RepID=UPI0025B32455|nr:EF-hand domain-containing protein [Vibrio tapetis]MDN3683122.1 EF-hand domain-containing protein [Vibrio tapetis subsp. quintayensis]